MKKFSTRQAAKELGIDPMTLSRYIRAGKVPVPTIFAVGDSSLHGWTEEEIENVRQLLPKIANGRKTRYKRANSNSQLATGQTRPKSKTKAKSRGKGRSKKKKK